MNDCNCNCPKPIVPNKDCGFNGSDKPGCSCGACGKPIKKCACEKPCPEKRKACPTELVVTFRKVLINATLGDDETGEVLPESGLYKNSLVEYEANNTVYFYDSDGIYTKLKSSAGVESVNGRTGKVTITTNMIGAATAEDLTTETEARIEKDTALQTEIDSINSSVYTKTEADAKFVEFTDTPTLDTAGVFKANFDTMVTLTQAEYDALPEHPATTMYYITE